MSWTDRSKFLNALIVLGAIAPSAALADALVVRSTGPSAASYKPGMPIPDSRPIVLKAGDSVVILDGRGTRTLRGPGTFNPAQSAGSQPTASLAALAQPRADRRARIGAVRPGIPAAIANTNIWNLDVTKGGAFCVADPARVTVFRSEVAKAGSAKISGDGKTAMVSWEAGIGGAPWPAALPVAAGGSYTITPVGGAPTTISIKLLDANLQGLEDTASKLITNGCQAQLDVLINAVAVPDERVS